MKRSLYSFVFCDNALLGANVPQASRTDLLGPAVLQTEARNCQSLAGMPAFRKAQAQLDSRLPGASDDLYRAYVSFEKQHGDRDAIEEAPDMHAGHCRSS